ncbi:5-hydroxytryptamine receptor 3A-like [Hoplias malabaricus]|uniref:5-hydroxytryptamine receptor 3A-like n=1 Tax=Hoplias malabaricus TaxID=27720 RepID=UPI0034629D22
MTMITIKRRPLLYVVIFFLPLLYFLVLDLASFFISDDGGEKLSFKVTLLLGISVLLLILHDMLPSTSEDLPLIGVYCSIIFTFTAVSLLETILVNFLKNRKLQVVQKLAGETMADSARLDGGERPPQHTPVSPGSGGESQNSTVLQQIVTELQKQHQETEKQKAAQKWTKVAEVIDKMFFSAYVSGVGLFLQQILTAWFPELS